MAERIHAKDILTVDQLAALSAAGLTIVALPKLPTSEQIMARESRKRAKKAWPRCSHKTAHDFSHETKHRRPWTCSHCERIEPWGESWGYYGDIECRRCGTQRIDFVACSDACARELLAAEGVGEAVSG